MIEIGTRPLEGETYMKALALAVVVGLIAIVASNAQPSVSALQNNYSYVLPGMPNYGIAQGSIFVMYGKNMGPSQIASAQSFPLNKTLAGVTINVTGSDGKTYQAIPYYVSATQSAAILPSSTPTGNATISVTYNSQTSAQAQVAVVKTAFGILTLNGTGSGDAAAFDARNNYLGLINAANPGEVVTLWGTGLGPAFGDETSVGGTAGDLGSNVPITVWVGGQQAAVQYHGRSQYPGLDQLNVVVPAGASGCSVSVVVQGGSMVSNFVTIPVAATGRVCSDMNGLPSSIVQSLFAKGNFSIGFIYLSKTTNFSTSGVPSDSAGAFFAQISSEFLTASGLGTQVSIGGCSLLVQNLPTPITGLKYLDAGTVTLSPPSGSSVPFLKTDLPGVGPLYTIPGSQASWIPASGGTFTFDNGAGGPSIGHFNTSMTLLAQNLVWTNIDQVADSVLASTPPTLTWTGGDPDGFISVTGSSMMINGQAATTTIFNCTVPPSAQKFTIPQWVLLAMAPSASVGGKPAGGLGINAWGQPQGFNVPSVDYAYHNWYVGSNKIVGYNNQ